MRQIKSSPLFVVSSLALGLLGSTAVLLGDQSCNSSHPNPPGVLDGGASGAGIGGSIEVASEAAFRALTGFDGKCALCDPEGDPETGQRCAGTGGVTMGPGGVSACWPLPVPLGFPPIWECVFSLDDDGGAWQWTCGDC